MHPQSRLLQLLSVLVVAMSIAACDKNDSPTTPSGPQPEIASISPAAIQPSEAPQTILFTGNGFDAGLQLFVTAPDGTTVTVANGGVQAIQTTSFQATLVFQQPGIYTFAVRNASGFASVNFTTVVQSPGSVLPVAYSVTPASVPRSTFQSTLVALQGANFAPNSAVIVTDPNGQTMILTSTSLSSQSATGIQFVFTFNVRGTYSLVVTNPNGDASNPIFIQVT